LEELMKSGKYEYQTEFVRQWIAQGLEQGRQQGLEQGLQQGLQQGRQQGLQQGEVAALLEVLDARGLEVDDAARQRITACTDLAQLKLWLRKAVTVRSTQELFDSKPA
jgi:flagellar biosynthesis/type III secretory pathway protein FliH